MLRLVSWNCRGLGNPCKIEAVKDLQKIDMPDLLLLQETKLDDNTVLAIGNEKWKKNTGYAISARGAFGGLSTLWTADKSHLHNSFATQHWIYTELTHIQSNKHIGLFNMYVPNLYSEKKDCWNLLDDFLDIYNPQDIILAGNMNLTLSNSKKRGGLIGKDPFKIQVEALMQTKDLIDIKPKKGKYTSGRISKLAWGT